jgi:peptide/nickel transport system ATP-binding protein
VDATPKTPVLEITDLSVDFAVDNVWVPAVKKLNYTINSGEVMALVGESGSGKSVSSMSILDLLPKNSRVSGSIKLNGVELRGAKPAQLRDVRGKDVAVIFQEPMTALNPVFTVGFQIVETLRLHFGMSPSQAKERAIELLALVELPDPVKAFNSYPHQLSGGQRQRAMIAQSISCDPKLLIADEPTTALDVTVQAEILDLIRSLRDRLGSAVLLITHDMGVVADIADHIAVMRKGEVVEAGPSLEVFRSPKHPYTQALLAAVPVPDPVFERARVYTPLRGEPPSPANPPSGCPFHTRCPRAIERCRSEPPALRETAPGRLVACHLAE